jgi:hypothetical protein
MAATVACLANNFTVFAEEVAQANAPKLLLKTPQFHTESWFIHQGQGCPTISKLFGVNLHKVFPATSNVICESLHSTTYFPNLAGQGPMASHGWAVAAQPKCEPLIGLGQAGLSVWSLSLLSSLYHSHHCFHLFQLSSCFVGGSGGWFVAWLMAALFVVVVVVVIVATSGGGGSVVEFFVRWADLKGTREGAG